MVGNAYRWFTVAAKEGVVISPLTLNDGLTELLKLP